MYSFPLISQFIVHSFFSIAPFPVFWCICICLGNSNVRGVALSFMIKTIICPMAWSSWSERQMRSPDIRIPRICRCHQNTGKGAMEKSYGLWTREIRGNEYMDRDWDCGLYHATPRSCQGCGSTSIKNLEVWRQEVQISMGHARRQQKTNLTLSETFAPVSRISSLRTLLAIATLNDLRIFAWDVDSAYLHGKIDHDLYVDFRGRVWKTW